MWFSAPRLNAQQQRSPSFSSRARQPRVSDLLNLGTSPGDQIEHVRENFRRYGEAVGFDSTKTVFSQQVHRDDAAGKSRRTAARALYQAGL